MWIKKLSEKQPPTKKKVVELETGGPLGRWMVKHNWGAFTLPLPFVVLIFYWSAEPTGTDIDPLIRVHEFVHVKQDEGNLFFLVSWIKYGWALFRAFYWRGWGHIGESLMDAYLANRYEVEAYAVETKAEQDGLPDWAK